METGTEDKESSPVNVVEDKQSDTNTSSSTNVSVINSVGAEKDTNSNPANVSLAEVVSVVEGIQGSSDGSAILIIPIHHIAETGNSKTVAAVEVAKSTDTAIDHNAVNPGNMTVPGEHSGRKEYTCDQCGKIFGVKASFVLHMKESHDVEVEFPRKDFMCEDCGKVFTLMSSLKRHKMTHTEACAISYKCSSCPKIFHYRSSVRRHEKTQHTEEEGGEIHPCEKCSKTFMYATSLRRHLKTHQAKEIYPCEHCTRCFEYLSSLKRHEKLHKQGKLFQCSICQRDFGYLSSLTRHMKTHERSLVCDICNRTFRLEKSYTKHLLSHSSNFVTQADTKDISDHHVYVRMDKTAAEFALSSLEDSDVNLTIGEVQENDMNSSTTSKGDGNQNVENNISGEFYPKRIQLNTGETENDSAIITVPNEESITKSFTLGQDNADVVEESTQELTLDNENTCSINESNQTEDEENASEVVEDNTGAFQQGIMVVEVDSDGRAVENKLEAFQSTNLLQLLQAVEGITSGELSSQRNGNN